MDGRSNSLAAQEEAVLQRLGPEFGWKRPSKRTPYDFETPGGAVVELKFRLLGIRDLDAALLQLAAVLAEQPQIPRGLLLARLPRMTAERVRREWERVLRILRPDLSDRLNMIAVAADRSVVVPEGVQDLLRITAHFQEAIRKDILGSLPSVRSAALSTPWSRKAFEIWKVLLDAWLGYEGRLPVQELALRSDCSIPTVAATLERLESYEEVERSSNRSVEFTRMPRRSLGEILPFVDSLRETARFVDATGSPDSVNLVQRIIRNARFGVALGGVEAARHYVSNFDLNGLPRVDLGVQRSDDLEWLRGVDPALRPARPDERSAALVVHRTGRTRNFLDPVFSSVLPLASPSEVLLDLYDLRLTSQANEFVQSMREKGRVKNGQP